LALDQVWQFGIASTIKYGDGVVDEIGYEAKRLKGTKVLIATDKGVAKTGILDKVKSSLEKEGISVGVFDGVLPDPPVEVYEQCLEFAKKNRRDAIIGLGGGSSMDVGKLIATALFHGAEILDYIGPPTGRGKPILGKGFPMIAVPTTSGTGSEVSPVAVITLSKEKMKVGVSSNYLRPDVALVDPLLTITLPPNLTASSGMDALAHAIESYTTRRYSAKPKPETPDKRPVYAGGNYLTDALAVRAIELIGRHLRRAVNNGDDLESRAGMALASLLAGMAFSNSGLGAIHAIAFPLSGKYGMPHGVTCALLLPHVLEFNFTSNFEKFATIARLMGENVDGLSLRDAAMKSVTAVKALSEDIGIPQKLRGFGVKREDIPRLAKDTMEIRRLLEGNPRRMTEKDIEIILRKAF